MPERPVFVGAADPAGMKQWRNNKAACDVGLLRKKKGCHLPGGRVRGGALRETREAKCMSLGTESDPFRTASRVAPLARCVKARPPPRDPAVPMKPPAVALYRRVAGLTKGAWKERCVAGQISRTLGRKTVRGPMGTSAT